MPRSDTPARPPWVIASLLALACLCALELALGGVPGEPWALPIVVCLVGLAGALHGAVVALAFAALRPSPRALQFTVWSAAALAGGALTAHELGAFARLGSRHHQLAVNTLLACAAGAVALAALLCLAQPARSRPGVLFRLGARARIALAALVFAASVTSVHVDRSYYVGLYAAAHSALRWFGLWTAMLAFALLLSRATLPRARAIRALPLMALALLPALLPASVQGRVALALGQRAFLSDLVRLAQVATDVDRDGHSALFGGGDCAPFDARVHPGAHDVPGNGVDENCVLGDAVAGSAATETIAQASGPSPLDVVLITIDTLRPDRLGVYDPKYGPKGRNTAPNLDRWARGAYVFRNAFSTGAWTVVALSSMVRGLNPRRLHWTPYFETSAFRMIPPDAPLRPGEKLLQFFPVPADDPHVTLAQLLQRRGMRTQAVVEDGHTTMLMPGAARLDRGFEQYLYSTHVRQSPDQYTIDRALRLLRQQSRERRFFLWVHMFGPHSPNEIHPSVPTYGSSVADGYDHEVRATDHELGRLLTALDALRPAPAVIVASDHGEVIAPHNRWHGYSLDEETMRIPLLLKLPGRRGGQIDAVVSLIDVFPTILGLTETPGPKNTDGIDLRTLLDGSAPAPRAVVTDFWRYDADRQRAIDAVAVTDGARFVFYDRLQGNAFETRSGDATRSWLSPQALRTDPLARTALGYLEESLPLPK